MSRCSWPLLIALLIPCTSQAELIRNLVYAQRGDQPLELDLAVPKTLAGRRPLIIFVHGGGWDSGNRDVYHELMSSLSSDGLAAATVSYRLSSEAPWPAQLEDVGDAIDWLSRQADQYLLDTQRIALAGDSAGAQIALARGLLGKEGDPDRRVRCILNVFGPTQLAKIGGAAQAKVVALLGSDASNAGNQYRHASPISHVDRTDPPVLSFHGTADPIVPFNQATSIHEALTSQEVPNHLVRMEGAGHEFDTNNSEYMNRIKAFFNDYLRGHSDLPFVTSEDFDAGVDRWVPTDRTAWTLSTEGPHSWYSLIKKRSNYQPKVRSPLNISRLNDVSVSDFVLDVDLQSTNEPYGHQSLCLFFGYQDPTHFYYVHFGRVADPHANSVFLVNDAPRVSIATERTDGTNWSRGWHRARIRRDTRSGSIEVFFDDMQKPVMKANDSTFRYGQVGIGSFDDVGAFDNLRLWGRPASPDAE